MTPFLFPVRLLYNVIEEIKSRYTHFSELFSAFSLTFRICVIRYDRHADDYPLTADKSDKQPEIILENRLLTACIAEVDRRVEAFAVHDEAIDAPGGK